MNRRDTQVFLLVAVLWAAAVATGSALLLHSSDAESGMETAPIYILGPARSLLSAGLYERADLYFHKGAPRIRKQAFHGFFSTWKEAIVPVEHAHTQGNETAEILPWLRLASQTDPHNIEIFLVASFWLNSDCERPDLAQQAILEAMNKNPDRYELQLEMGRLQLSTDEFQAAMKSFEKAQALISIQNKKDPEQATIDYSYLLTSLSYVYEALGHQEEAIKTTRKLLELHPASHTFERLEKLASGQLDSEAAQVRLRQLFKKTHSCERSGDEEHVHGEHCNHD